MSSKPLVSILMNCYNGSQYIKQAIESAVSQTYQNWELIIWDNQSTDNSALVIADFLSDERIRYFYAPSHTNLGGGRAAAWSKLRGKYLVVLDTDDRFGKTKIELQVQALESNRDCGICLSNVEFFSSNYKENLYSKAPPIDQGVSRLIKNYYICLTTVMISLDYARQFDFSFNSQFSHIADFDLIVRIATKFDIVYIDQVLTGWRVHPESESWKRPEQFYFESVRWCDYYLGTEAFVDFSKEIILLRKKNRRRLFSEYICKGQYKELILIAKGSKWQALVFFLTGLIYLPIYMLLTKRDEIRLKWKWK